MSGMNVHIVTCNHTMRMLPSIDGLKLQNGMPSRWRQAAAGPGAEPAAGSLRCRREARLDRPGAAPPPSARAAPLALRRAPHHRGPPPWTLALGGGGATSDHKQYMIAPGSRIYMFVLIPSGKAGWARASHDAWLKPALAGPGATYRSLACISHPQRPHQQPLRSAARDGRRHGFRTRAAGTRARCFASGVDRRAVLGPVAAQVAAEQLGRVAVQRRAAPQRLPCGALHAPGRRRARERAGRRRGDGDGRGRRLRGGCVLPPSRFASRPSRLLLDTLGSPGWFRAAVASAAPCFGGCRCRSLSLSFPRDF